MDILDEELLKFWKSPNDNNVQYIMVGGFAVNMHGYSRATNDIDVWLKDDINNRRNLGKHFNSSATVIFHGTNCSLFPDGPNFMLARE